MTSRIFSACAAEMGANGTSSTLLLQIALLRIFHFGIFGTKHHNTVAFPTASLQNDPTPEWQSASEPHDILFQDAFTPR